MAEDQKSGDVRRQALLALEQARAEISAQAAELRHDLNPANAAKAALTKHPAWVMLAAAGAGLTLSWLLLRRRPEPELPSRRELKQAVAEATRKKASKRVLGSLLPASMIGPVAAMAVKAAFPYLMKAGLKYYEQRKSGPVKNSSQPIP